MPITFTVIDAAGLPHPHQGDIALGGARLFAPDTYRFAKVLELGFVLPGEAKPRQVSAQVLRYVVDDDSVAAVLVFKNPPLDDEMAIARAIDRWLDEQSLR
jgi:hypothetical protein